MKTRCLALLLSTLLLAGCTPEGPAAGSRSPSAPASSAPAERSGVPGVQVDWSRLEGRTGRLPDTDGGRWYPDRTDRLIPRPDYGLLVPYVGDQAYSFNRWEREGEIQEHFSDWPTAFYGLMTREGKIVVDPVYQHAIPWGGEDLALPVLLLARADEAWREDNSGLRYAVAAEDGSWITDFAFLSYTNREDQLFLLRPEGCTQLDTASGARKDWSWAELGVSEQEVPEVLTSVQWVTGLFWLDQGVCLGQRMDEDSDGSWENAQARIFQPNTGEVYWVEQRQWDQWYDEYSDRRWSDRGKLVHENGGISLTVDGQSYFLKDTYETGRLSIKRGDFAILDEQHAGNNIWTLYRLSTGERLMEGTEFELIADRFRPNSIFPAAYEWGAWTVFNDRLEPVLTLPPTQRDEWVQFSLQDGLLTFKGNDSTFFGAYDLDKGEYVFFRNLDMGD